MNSAMFPRSVLSLAVLMATTSVASLNVSAETFALEEIVVTAQKREESLMDVPISVNAVSGEKMSEAGITELEGMTAYVPNLTMNQTGIGTIIAFAVSVQVLIRVLSSPWGNMSMASIMVGRSWPEHLSWILTA